MTNSRQLRRFQSRRCPAGIEALERRDCPAVLGITGTGELSEAAGATYLTVSLSAAETKPVAVDYYLTGTATTGRDYRLQSGSTLLATPTGTLTFRPGETSKTIKVGIVNDLDREPTETVGITLFKARNATIGTAKSATVTAVDDDSYTATIVGRPRLAEGRIGTYELRLSTPATKTETFYVNTEGGIATSGVDFRPLSQLPLIFNPGESVKKFRIQTLADGIANEYDEFFFLRLTPMSAGFPKVDPFGITIPGIGPAPLPGVSVSDVTVTEGNADKTAASFTISLSARYGLPVTLNYATADGTATVADKDYESVTGSVTIAPGDTTAMVTVNVIGDTKFEPDETFSLVVSAPVNATLTKATGVATIRNDESAFQIDLKFVDSSLGSVPADVQALARLATDRWMKVITGDLPNVPLAGGDVIDDFELTVQMGLLGGSPNGPGGAIANAVPTAYRSGQYGLPYQGITGLDPNDVRNISSTAGRQWVIDVITHELGHALGFGAGFKPFNPWLAGDSFTGPNAVREYQSKFNTSAASVPLQAGIRGHWDEDVFGDELMTPDAAFVGTSMPISTVTIGALQDMGYAVDYNAAEPYTIPSGLQSPPAMVSSGTTSARMMALTSLPPSFFAALAGTFGEAGPGTGKQRAFARLAKG